MNPIPDPQLTGYEQNLYNIIPGLLDNRVSFYEKFNQLIPYLDIPDFADQAIQAIYALIREVSEYNSQLETVFEQIYLMDRNVTNFLYSILQTERPSSKKSELALKYFLIIVGRESAWAMCALGISISACPVMDRSSILAQMQSLEVVLPNLLIANRLTQKLRPEDRDEDDPAPLPATQWDEDLLKNLFYVVNFLRKDITEGILSVTSLEMPESVTEYDHLMVPKLVISLLETVGNMYGYDFASNIMSAIHAKNINLLIELLADKPANLRALVIRTIQNKTQIYPHVQTTIDSLLNQQEALLTYCSPQLQQVAAKVGGWLRLGEVIF